MAVLYLLLAGERTENASSAGNARSAGMHEEDAR
jgi:hypothetical protein